MGGGWRVAGGGRWRGVGRARWHATRRATACAVASKEDLGGGRGGGAGGACHLQDDAEGVALREPLLHVHDAHVGQHRVLLSSKAASSTGESSGADYGTARQGAAEHDRAPEGGSDLLVGEARSGCEAHAASRGVARRSES